MLGQRLLLFQWRERKQWRFPLRVRRCEVRVRRQMWTGFMVEEDGTWKKKEENKIEIWREMWVMRYMF
ncbi:hypothetical protein RHGRI_007592 [Rhododendron griersonianum]|uniref:Uncharacterized protein n=1 Tax=Rhododendron griersonianum TaxID=479676 RepID=A0AAV6KY62_9ERIC|nr:hypothetical protein RHGRI_007592 [Rhododendron griersonianum]